MNNPNIIERVGYDSMKEGLVIGKFVVEKRRGKVMAMKMLVVKKEEVLKGRSLSLEWNGEGMEGGARPSWDKVGTQGHFLVCMY